MEPTEERINRVPPQWQRLGFSSEEDMNRNEAIYKRRKAQIDYIAKLIYQAHWHNPEEKENKNGRD